jgi:hypothetical protein
MKTKIVSKILLSVGLVVVLGSAITQVHGFIPPPGPVVTIYGTDNVVRGKTGSFVLRVNPAFPVTYVNFKVSGTAIPGVDYVALVAPAYVGQPGYGTILVKTLPNPRASFGSQAYSVVVTLEPGAGYAVGTPSSATIWIKSCAACGPAGGN